MAGPGHVLHTGISATTHTPAWVPLSHITQPVSFLPSAWDWGPSCPYLPCPFTIPFCLWPSWLQLLCLMPNRFMPTTCPTLPRFPTCHAMHPHAWLPSLQLPTPSLLPFLPAYLPQFSFCVFCLPACLLQGPLCFCVVPLPSAVLLACATLPIPHSCLPSIVAGSLWSPLLPDSQPQSLLPCLLHTCLTCHHLLLPACHRSPCSPPPYLPGSPTLLPPSYLPETLPVASVFLDTHTLTTFLPLICSPWFHPFLLPYYLYYSPLQVLHPIVATYTTSHLYFTLHRSHRHHLPPTSHFLLPAHSALLLFPSPHHAFHPSSFLPHLPAFYHSPPPACPYAYLCLYAMITCTHYLHVCHAALYFHACTCLSLGPHLPAYVPILRLFAFCTHTCHTRLLLRTCLISCLHTVAVGHLPVYTTFSFTMQHTFMGSYIPHTGPFLACALLFLAWDQGFGTTFTTTTTCSARCTHRPYTSLSQSSDGKSILLPSPTTHAFAVLLETRVAVIAPHFPL